MTTVLPNWKHVDKLYAHNVNLKKSTTPSFSFLFWDTTYYMKRRQGMAFGLEWKDP